MPIPKVLRHPMQPIYKDKDGLPRFLANGIIQRIVDEKMVDLNAIPNWMYAYSGITQDDIDQFWQLMGYSIGGYCEIAGSDVVSDQAADQAIAEAEKIN